MKNVKTELKGKILTITVDLGKEYGISKSGKSQVIATSEGNQKIDGTDDIKIGLNIYRPV
jgi:hypothetical protein